MKTVNNTINNLDYVYPRTQLTDNLHHFQAHIFGKKNYSHRENPSKFLK